MENFYHHAYSWLLVRGKRGIAGLIVFFIGVWLIKRIRSRLRGRMNKTKVHSSLQPFILSLAIPALYGLLSVIVIDILGFQLTIFTTIIGAFTVAAGLALSGTFQNFAGGVLILLLRPFEVDNYIAAQGQEGIVTTIQVFYTELLTLDNKTVIIPNGKLFNEVIVNISRENKRRLDLEIKLGYAVDVEQVKDVIHNSIEATANILTGPPPRVGVIALEIDGIKFTVDVWVEPENFITTKIALQENIIKNMVTAGIKLPGT